MTNPKDFTTWLQGVLDGTENPSEKTWELLQLKLKTVFDKKTPNLNPSPTIFLC
jgi:hypothetical protein